MTVNFNADTEYKPFSVFSKRNVIGNEVETVYTAVQQNLELKTVEVNYFNIYVTTNFGYNRANL
jgi:hypothetical protein